MSLRKTPACALFCLVQSVLPAEVAGPPATQAVRGSGVLECTFYRHDGDRFASQRLPFALIYMGANRWHLWNEEESGSYWERGCDGTNIYAVFHDKEQELPALAGIVEPGVVPSGNYPVAIPWLSLASGHFLSTNTVFPAPWADPRNQVMAHAYKSDFVLSDEPPFVPREVVWTVTTNRGAVRSRASAWIVGASRIAELFRPDWRPPDPTNFVAARYSAHSFTNVGSLVLPTRIELVRYRSPQAPLGFTNHPIVSTFRATFSYAITEAPVSPTPLLLQKPVHVTDLRFTDSKGNLTPIRYAVTGQWETAISPDKLKLLLERFGAERAVDRQIGRIVSTAVFVLVLALPVLVWGWKRVICQYQPNKNPNE